MEQISFLFPEEKEPDASFLPENWKKFLLSVPGCSLPDDILLKVSAERKAKKVFPPEKDVFRAFQLTPPGQVKICILGQDPYHDDGQAEGLAFSVREDVKIPASLRNIFKEYASDLGRKLPVSGSLRNWAAHGILLLNSVLTVRAHEPGSHAKLGWQIFTDSVIRALSEKADHRIVFILWGAYAQQKVSLINAEKHSLIFSAHPSPFSAHRGFFGSRPFSRAAALTGKDWPELTSENAGSR